MTSEAKREPKPELKPEAATAAAAAGRPLLAAAWMIGAVASFSTMAVAGRELSLAGLNTFEIMFWRSLVGLPAIVLLVALSGSGFRQLATARVSLHTLRHTIHFAGQNAWFYAISLAPLAQVIALEFTSPVWVALLAPLLLGERLTRWRAVAAFLGFLGVLVITRPGFGEANLGQAFALIAAVSFALTNLGTKSLTRSDSTLNIVFWMTLSQLAMAYVCDVVFTGEGISAPTAELAPMLLLIGAAGFAAHFTLTTAYRVADAGVVAPMEFARLPVVAALGAILYAEGLEPWVLIGGAIIFVGNFLNVRAESRRKA